MQPFSRRLRGLSLSQNFVILEKKRDKQLRKSTSLITLVASLCHVASDVLSHIPNAITDLCKSFKKTLHIISLAQLSSLGGRRSNEHSHNGVSQDYS